MNPGTMPFGKHQGKHLQDVPLNYLLWCLAEIGPGLNKYGLNLQAAIYQEAKRRSERDAPDDEDMDQLSRESNLPARLEPLIDRWYRGLVMTFHPDRGGSHEAMKAINEANDRLRQLVGV